MADWHVGQKVVYAAREPAGLSVRALLIGVVVFCAAFWAGVVVFCAAFWAGVVVFCAAFWAGVAYLMGVL